MEDLIIAEYLRKKGYDKNLSDYDFMNRHKTIPEYSHIHEEPEYKEIHHTTEYKPVLGLGISKDFHEKEHSHMYHDMDKTENLGESFVKYLVSNMCHYENGKKYIGEKYDKIKAKEVYERYRGLIPSNVDFRDIYLAINSQYHSYACLFKSWFGSDIDHKIIESAIIYWFKDENYEGNQKLWEHFKNK